MTATSAGLVMVGVVAAAGLAGCEKDEPSDKQARTEPAAPAYTSAQVEAVLAKADTFDGKADKVVSKCAACALYMDGMEEHALEAHGYKLHFCSEHCLEQFAKNPDKAIMEMQFPEAEGG